MNFKQLCLSGIAIVAMVIAAVAISFEWLDVVIATIFRANMGRYDALSQGLASSVLLSIEFGLLATLAMVRILKGHLSHYGKTLLIATLASICAFVANDYVLKILFGVPNPYSVLVARAPHAIHLLKGDRADSFPSGHMAMACAFLAVWARLQPVTTMLAFCFATACGAALIWGDWHFLSDVIAGAALGSVAGWLAGELWLRHTSHT